MKPLVYSLFISVTLMVSCMKADSDKEWGLALIYMPQANYMPYEVPNNGTDFQMNKNYSIDLENNVVNVFLGVYRSGLQVLDEYAVNITSETESLENATLLPLDKYTLPATVTCPSGQRDETFYLSVDLDFLKSNPKTNYGLSVTITNPTKYALNEDLVTTNVLIKTSDLLKKEGLN